MELVLRQLYEFMMGMVLGGSLSFFYACYRLQFHGGHYSRRQLLVTDSLWWLFAVVVTVGILFFLEWGALRALFFLWLFLGFSLGYSFLWQPLLQKVRGLFSGKPKPPHISGPTGIVPVTKEHSFLEKSFDVAATGIYRGYACGKRRYVETKKQNQAAVEKWKKQVSMQRQRLKHRVLQALWPQNRKENETDIPEDYQDEE